MAASNEEKVPKEDNRKNVNKENDKKYQSIKYEFQAACQYKFTGFIDMHFS